MVNGLIPLPFGLGQALASQGLKVCDSYGWSRRMHSAVIPSIRKLSSHRGGKWVMVLNLYIINIIKFVYSIYLYKFLYKYIF
jgi:hypothetical protein